MKLKLAMRNRSFSCLLELPLCSPKYDPLFLLLRQMQLYAMFSGNEDLQKVIVWKSIQFAIKHGMGRLLPTILAFYAGPLSVNGKVDTAQEIGNVAIALLSRFGSMRNYQELCLWMCFDPTPIISECSRPFASSLQRFKNCRRGCSIYTRFHDGLF